jgi:hypothetical protein
MFVVSCTTIVRGITYKKEQENKESFEVMEREKLKGTKHKARG